MLRRNRRAGVNPLVVDAPQHADVERSASAKVWLNRQGNRIDMDARDALMVGTRTDGAKVARPLSPHLQVYRPQLTSALSIMHRITGVGLAVGAGVLVWWLVAAAGSPASFATVQNVLGSWLGRLFLFGWTVALFFHLANGIRHLWWDSGRGLNLPSVYSTGYMTLAATAVLTLGSWVAWYVVRG
jgi:succinate dehydrogenase / fumarate reductase cytochrome b subunit